MYSESMSWTKLYARHGWALQGVRPGHSWEPDIFGSSLPFTDHLQCAGGPSIPHSGSTAAVPVRLGECLNTKKRTPGRVQHASSSTGHHGGGAPCLAVYTHAWLGSELGYPLKFCRATGKLGGQDVTGSLVVVGFER